MPSGNALALAALAGLNARQADLAIEKQAAELVEAIGGDLLQVPSAHVYALRANAILRDGGSGPIWYGARGAIRIAARRENNVVVVDLLIRKGWHIQAHKPLQKDLIGTSLSALGPMGAAPLLNTTYPKPVVK